MKQTIGFFGDSFCEHLKNSHSITNHYKTYIENLIYHYDLKLVNLGQSGGSIWDLWIKQLTPFIERNEIPDICVFVWTDPFRLYNPVVRNINMASTVLQKIDKNHSIWNAATEYYRHLFDEDHLRLSYVSALHYFDNVIIPAFPKKTKVIHLWSFGYAKVTETGMFDLKKIEYLYNWKNGVEIRPALIELASLDAEKDTIFHFEYPNHIPDDYRNQLLFEWIKNAIENYDNKLIEFKL